MSLFVTFFGCCVQIIAYMTHRAPGGSRSVYRLQPYTVDARSETNKQSVCRAGEADPSDPESLPAAQCEVASWRVAGWREPGICVQYILLKIESSVKRMRHGHARRITTVDTRTNSCFQMPYGIWCLSCTYMIEPTCTPTYKLYINQSIGTRAGLTHHHTHGDDGIGRR